MRAIATLLDEPAEDVTELAERVIQTLDEMRAKRDLFVAVIHNPGLGLAVAGTFDTRRQAQRFLERDVAGATEGARGGVFLLLKEWSEA